jgi:hypothetical protein
MKARHQPTKRELLARMPRAFRPKLHRESLLALALCHNVNLDAIDRGDAEPSILWDFLGCVFVWHQVAVSLGNGVAEMVPQLEVATRLVENYRDTGRIAFTARDYQLARHGVVIMDELARLVDLPTAVMAVDWSEAECNRIADLVTMYQQQKVAA